MDGKRLAPLFLIGLFIIVALQIGEFALLWSKDIHPPEYVYLPATADKTATDTAPVSAPVVVVSPPDEKTLRQIIQAVLEQELAPYARQLAATPEATRKTNTANISGVKENSPENIQAFTEASALMESALASGRWTADFNLEMQMHSKNLTPEQHEQLLNKAGQAFMNKQLTAEGNDIPIF